MIILYYLFFFKFQDYKYWVYERTKPLPSYLYCVIAGEYWSIKDDNNYIS